MAYGLKYQNQFKNVAAVADQRLYTLQFLFKDYTGGTITVTGGETSVRQKCTIDDPIAPIKGQSLDITLVNENLSLPITSFQSEGDDDVMVKLLDGSDVLFVGFMVQDDFYELLFDTAHTITLSANDSLGLLKGVLLSEANEPLRRSFTATFRTFPARPLNIIHTYVADGAFYPQAGNTIEYSGVTYSIVSAVNEITSIIGIGYYNWTIEVSPSPVAQIPQTTGTIYLTGSLNLLSKNSLLSLISVCLAQTNLQLTTNIFHNLHEERQDPAISTFAQTLIDTQTFINGDKYDDSYTVLTKILQAFGCTLFQANGEWNIVHWYEAKRYTNQAIPGFVYDTAWAPAGTTVLDNNFLIGPANDTTWLAGLQQGAIRGLKFSRKVFDFVQPKYLLQVYPIPLSLYQVTVIAP